MNDFNGLNFFFKIGNFGFYIPKKMIETFIGKFYNYYNYKIWFKRFVRDLFGRGTWTPISEPLIKKKNFRSIKKDLFSFFI